MSSPACADGYNTPAQQREDATFFMVMQSRAAIHGDRRASLGDHDHGATVNITPSRSDATPGVP